MSLKIPLPLKGITPFKPAMLLWALLALGILSSCFSFWGLWRVTEMSTSYQRKDDQTLLLSVDLKENIVSFAKLTYDFLLQQDFNRMMLKEKQSNGIRRAITSDLAQLTEIRASPTASSMIEEARYKVLQFLLLSDKALERAVEEGSANHARLTLQDEVEPALQQAQDSVNNLINSRQKFGDENTRMIRQQAVMVGLLLFGMMALCAALVLMMRIHFLRDHKPSHSLPALRQEPHPVYSFEEDEERVRDAEERRAREVRTLEARSLVTLAVVNRLSRLDKENEELRRMVAALKHNALREFSDLPREAGHEGVLILQRQNERIAQTVNRIEGISEHIKQFMESMNKLMGGIQSMATDGNMIALNVTIELAKLQAQAHGSVKDEKNARISEQIRALAATAAGVTGKMAMILSQFRYAQEDFVKYVAELAKVKGQGGDALEDIRKDLSFKAQESVMLLQERRELLAQLPGLEEKLENIRKQTTHIQALMMDNPIQSDATEAPERTFKVISGGAA